MSTRSVNMLSGPLYRELLAFSLPIAVTAILEQLFNKRIAICRTIDKPRKHLSSDDRAAVWAS